MLGKEWCLIISEYILFWSSSNPNIQPSQGCVTYDVVTYD